MGENRMMSRPISAAQVVEAMHLACVDGGDTVEDPEPACAWPRLCTESSCRFPSYHRAGRPTGLTAHVLRELGYPLEVLKDLDWEYEVGEVLHPGVKIGRSRNPALRRIDAPGVALLQFLQNHQKVGWSWSRIAVQAIRPGWMIKRLDARRRPWLY